MSFQFSVFSFQFSVFSFQFSVFIEDCFALPARASSICEHLSEGRAAEAGLGQLLPVTRHSQDYRH